ncbi:MAG TPA: NfeD family protein [Phycisphaerales bacterium]|nr:NfeD family protein [Phycisphaerales bacterium]
MTDSSTLVLWGFGLIIASLLVVGIEMFVPSGGLLGVVAAVLAIAGVIAFFRADPVWGVLSLVSVLILAPIIVNFGLKVMPNTPLGKKLILGGSPSEEEMRRAAGEEALQHSREAALVGATGTAMTDLRPVGTVDIDGTRVEVLAEGGMVRAGAKVRVTGVSGTQVKVREIA